MSKGLLDVEKPVTLKAAHRAMLDALGHKQPPSGMGYDVFGKAGEVRAWLKQKGIYG